MLKTSSPSIVKDAPQVVVAGVSHLEVNGIGPERQWSRVRRAAAP